MLFTKNLMMPLVYMNNLISVVMSVKDSSNTVKESIESVLDQTF